jgi:hypothetical protein
MFTQVWERFRGFDKWLEVQAVVESVPSWGLPSIARPTDFQPRYTIWKPLIKAMTIRYKSPGGAVHSKTVWLFDCPLLFALGPGDEFYMCCSPEDPDKIYISENTKGVFQAMAGLAIAFFVLAWSIKRGR